MKEEKSLPIGELKDLRTMNIGRIFGRKEKEEDELAKRLEWRMRHLESLIEQTDIRINRLKAMNIPNLRSSELDAADREYYQEKYFKRALQQELAKLKLTKKARLSRENLESVIENEGIDL